MPNIGGQVIAKPVPVAEYTVKNLTLTTANTEYTYALPNNSRYFIVQCRDNADVKLGKLGGSGSEFWTIFSGQQYDSPVLSIDSISLYFQSTKAGAVVEIVSWQ